MKIIAINGSPRKKNNSMELLQKWINGVKSVNPDADAVAIAAHSPRGVTLVKITVTKINA